MISTLVSIQSLKDKGRWDFSSHAPEYQKILELINQSRWDSCKLESVVERFEYGISLNSGRLEKGVPLLRVQNIQEHRVDLSDISYISEKIEEIDKYRLEAGDVVVTRSGANIGVSAVISKKLSGIVHSSYSIMLRPAKDKISSEYLAIILNSSLLKPQFFALKGGSAQPNINIAGLKALQIPLPPFGIQKQISSVMQHSYEQAEQLRAQANKLIDEAQARVERMVLGEEEIG